MPPEQVILFIVGTVVILFGAYYVTYYIGMKASGQTRAGFRNRNIILLDRYAIARDKQFCVIEVAGKVYVIGMTNHTMTLLDTLDAAAFAKLTEDNQDITPWNMTPVGQYGNKLTRKLVAFIAEKTGKAQPQQKKTDCCGADFSESLKEAERVAGDTNDKNAKEQQIHDAIIESPEEKPPDGEPSDNQPEKAEES